MQNGRWGMLMLACSDVGQEGRVSNTVQVFRAWSTKLMFINQSEQFYWITDPCLDFQGIIPRRKFLWTFICRWGTEPIYMWDSHTITAPNNFHLHQQAIDGSMWLSASHKWCMRFKRIVLQPTAIPSGVNVPVRWKHWNGFSRGINQWNTNAPRTHNSPTVGKPMTPSSMQPVDFSHGLGR